ncbi:hypothetical protein GGR57DRAFT_505340 [Xylariaceae sp. FL1272]|nr:hypothetical protein GGR57DRAFT_505340 [Xylariaceae sp. FL1272]
MAEAAAAFGLAGIIQGVAQQTEALRLLGDMSNESKEVRKLLKQSTADAKVLCNNIMDLVIRGPSKQIDNEDEKANGQITTRSSDVARFNGGNVRTRVAGIGGRLERWPLLRDAVCADRKWYMQSAFATPQRAMIACLLECGANPNQQPRPGKYRLKVDVKEDARLPLKVVVAVLNLLTTNYLSRLFTSKLNMSWILGIKTNPTCWVGFLAWSLNINVGDIESVQHWADD